MNNIEYLVKKFKMIDIELSDSQVKQFDEYFEMLIEWNKVMNLTSITEEREVIDKHFVDSIAINVVMEFKNRLSGNIKVLDIGTGAGFPGIPLKIVFPELKITLLDSLNKRINFLNNVIEKLKLSEIEAFHGRAEEYGRNKKYREQYDIVVSRAVANISTLSEYCIPFVKKGGCFISYKSGKLDEELKISGNAIKILGGKLEKIVEITLPETDIERKFAVINKINNTQNKYPRGQGKPSKEPLR